MTPIPRRVVYHAPGAVAGLARLAAPGELESGKQVEAFEREVAAAVGTAHAVAVPSARYALRALLGALGLDPGGEVIVPAYTDPSMPEAVARAGLIPVFADIRPDDDNMDPAAVEAKATPRTVAILATHLFGNPCAVGRLAEIASKCGAALIEDYSHSFGAKYDGRPVGSFGAAGFCTFNSSKFFNTFGGGMLTTGDAALADKVRAARDKLPAPTAAALLRSAVLSFGTGVATSFPGYHLGIYPVQRLLGISGKDIYKYYKETYSVWKNTPREVRYTEFQARLGRRSLERMNAEHARRSTRSLRLDAALNPEIHRLRPVPPGESIWWQYIIRGGATAAEADALQRRLLARGIDTGRNFLAHAAADYDVAENYPNASAAVATSVQIPNHPGLSDSRIDRIAAAVNELYGKQGGTRK